MRKLMLASTLSGCCKTGAKGTMIHSVYFNKVALAVTFFEKINMEELWVDFDTEKKIRYIPIHDTFRALGKDMY